MKARKFNKQIEVYTISAQSDGFGGNTNTSILLKKVWCNLKTIKGSSVANIEGLDFTQNNLQITVRENPNINYNSEGLLLKYRGAEYTITSFPQNTNFTDAYITFIAVMNKPSGTPTPTV